MINPQPNNRFLNRLLSERPVAFISFLWSFAEGVFFFIVPDVYILFVTMFSSTQGLRGWGYSIAGSFCSVLVLWALARIYSPSSLLDLLAVLPGITPELNAHVAQNLSLHGLPFTPLLVLGGIPLKVYTLTAFSQGYGLLAVLGWAIFSRVVRIGPGYLMMSAVRRLFHKSIDSHRVVWICGYILFWIIFYIYYFKKMGI
jgi:hypothetical protein